MDGPEFSHEIGLLLACAPARPGGEGLARIAGLAGKPHGWHRCVEVASALSLAPLMAINLRRAGILIPEYAERRLEAELFAATADGLAAARQMRDLQVRFAAAGIRAVTYKGPALAAAAYGHAARPLRDLDVLVTRRALPAARSVLAAEGYRLDLKAHRLFAALPAAAREDHFHPPAAGLLTVELHAAVTPWALAARFDTAALASRAVEVLAGGAPLLTFAPEDHLLIVAAHATAHDWSFLRHVTDLDGLIGAGVEWPLILARAREARVERMLAVGLTLAHDALGTALPADVVSWMRRDRAAAVLAAYARSRWFDPSALVLRRWPAALHAARYRERVADKARYLAREQITSLLEKLPWERWRPPPLHPSSPTGRR